MSKHWLHEDAFRRKTARPLKKLEREGNRNIASLMADFEVFELEVEKENVDHRTEDEGKLGPGPTDEGEEVEPHGFAQISWS